MVVFMEKINNKKEVQFSIRPFFLTKKTIFSILVKYFKQNLLKISPKAIQKVIILR